VAAFFVYVIVFALFVFILAISPALSYREDGREKGNDKIRADPQVALRFEEGQCGRKFRRAGGHSWISAAAVGTSSSGLVGNEHIHHRHTHCRAWLDAGFETQDVNLAQQTLVFQRH
jgi:hypothetical protein